MKLFLTIDFVFEIINLNIINKFGKCEYVKSRECIEILALIMLVNFTGE